METDKPVLDVAEPQLVLSDYETKMVLAHREKQNKIKNQARTKLYILAIAYHYDDWLQSNGLGSSYSTFCDDYGYGAGHKILYDAIETVRTLWGKKSLNAIRFCLFRNQKNSPQEWHKVNAHIFRTCDEDGF